MKKLCTMLTAVLVLGLAVSASATVFTDNLQDFTADKMATWTPVQGGTATASAGGETIASAVPIAVGGSSTGYTCDNVDDYDEICPFTGSTSPDEVYSVTVASAAQITVDLCTSDYDTKVYVYENAAGNLVACNDDFCNDEFGNPFRSRVDCVSVTPGNTYYIVVDGYFGDCGNYDISVYASSGCPLPCDPEDCPPGAVLEGEPVCFDGYIDNYNAGCNSTPNSFVNLTCADGVTVCGTVGTYIANGLNYRDTDWYQISLPMACNVTVSMCAGFNSLVGIIDGDAGCGAPVFACYNFGTPGTSTGCSVAESGLVWLFASTGDFVGVPCGSAYTLTALLPCCPSNATESKSWGGIKGLYR
jgi:hypothetical protein